MTAPLPGNETARLRLLEEYAVLDTPAEAAFDDIVQLAAYLCGTPIALISLLDPTRQWFKARTGLDSAQTPRDQAFCAYAIHRPAEIMIVPDATLDARFVDNPLVTGDPHIRFYAGVPLTAPTGEAIGTLPEIARASALAAVSGGGRGPWLARAAEHPR